jgi:hypothetical protein
MGDLLKNTKVEGQVSKEAAQKFYEEYAKPGFLGVVDYKFDKEDLKFAFDNFANFTQEQASLLFFSNDGDAGIWGGTLADRIDPADPEIKQAWWLFLGEGYLGQNPDLQTTNQVVEYLETVGGITAAFPNTSVEYNQFNFNTFSEKVTTALNIYLDTENPEIIKPGYAIPQRHLPTSIYTINYFTAPLSLSNYEVPVRLNSLGKRLNNVQYDLFNNIIKESTLGTEKCNMGQPCWD